MKFLMNFFKKHKILSIIILIVIIIIILSLTRKKSPPAIETQIVSRQNVSQTIEETGVVQAMEEAELSFESMGVISSFSVQKGDSVRAGDVLAKLEDREHYANLLSARARLQAEEAVLSGLLANTGNGASSDSRLGVTLAQQEINVAEAYRNFLNNDLEVYPDSPESQDLPAPIISGTYNSDQEGVYIIETYASSSDSGVSIKLSGMEEGYYSASTQFPTPIGTRGLYLRFTEIRPNSKWTIQIPNTRSASYGAALGAYKAAEASKDVVISGTRSTPEQISAQEAAVAGARAAVFSAEVQFSKRTLRAPFSGIVSEIHKNKGEVASGTIVSLVSDNLYQIVVNIPEIDIANINAGDDVEVRFDAYDDVVFDAKVSFVSPIAVTTNGVATFKTTILFSEADERIKAGLSANVKILAEERENVLSVPSRAVIEESGKRFVRVMEGETSYRRIPVTIGLRGGGMTEIIAGLEGGEKIITFANPATISSLTDLGE
jgi:multidrug efflux pump subunit AcrA (membrane-fusion protein)